jgi:hypothetical protein
MLLRLAALFLAALVAGCASIDPAVYSDQKPALDLRRYFDGRLEGHGMVLDRSGQVTRRFVVAIRGDWQGDTGTLTEDFLWSDGERETRVWTLTPVPGQPGRWEGRAENVLGSAQGTIAGNALNWRYAYRLKTGDGSTYDLDFDDWMFRIDDKVLLNRAVLTFWGFRVGEVVIAFRRAG